MDRFMKSDKDKNELLNWAELKEFTFLYLILGQWEK